ncbi:S-adenosylmethionine decarboxylase [Niabella sp. CC-SYL272]|nr:S-adenosylmethionine decarboxylase [Niabella agricola]
MPQGFTAVICLSESYVSIHTWPEHNLVNLDIYLSNRERSIDKMVLHVFNGIVLFYDHPHIAPLQWNKKTASLMKAA